MAYDKVVDSTQLNADLTSVANAIRTKGGTSASLAFPAGFVSAIESIPSGGNRIPDDIIKVIRNFSLVPFGHTSPTKYTLPEEVELDFTNTYDFLTTSESLNLQSLMGGTWGDTGLRKITIKANSDRYINVNSAFSSQQYLTEIVFTNGLKTANDFAKVFNSCSRLVTIDGVIDCGGSWWNNAFSTCNALQNVRFAENCIGKTSPNNISFSSSSALTNDSIVSIANGLYEGAGKTITLHATPKATCSTIMGTVSTDIGNTYHIFTVDASGTVSLTDFITITKGWTLA